MRTLLSLALISLCCSFSAQETITYPYNPDGNQDGTITVPDLQDFLGNYGSAFAPSEITVNGETLSTVILDMQNTINELINLNDSPTTVIHGAYNFSDESQFLIPNYVNTVYLELEGATGGNGGSVFTDLYGQLNGCLGGDAIKVNVIMEVNFGDTIQVEVSQNGLNGPVTDGGFNNYQIYTPPGENGQDLILLINNEPLITIVGGEAGNGYTYYGSLDNPCLSGGIGNNGYIIYHDSYDQYPIMIVSSSIGDSQNKAVIKY